MPRTRWLSLLVLLLAPVVLLAPSSNSITAGNLRSIQDANQARVAVLVEQLTGEEVGDRGLQSRITALKAQGEADFLREWVISTGLLGAEPKAAEGVAAWLPGGNAVCTAAGVQHQVVAISDGGTGAYVVWSDQRDPTDRVYVQRVLADGTMAWTANGKLVSTAGGGGIHPTVASDGSGGVYVGWREVGFDAVIRLQRFTSMGSVYPGWPVDGILVTTLSRVYWPVLCEDGSGGVTMTWLYAPAGNLDQNELHGQRFNGTGAKLWSSGNVVVSTRPVRTYTYFVGTKMVTDGTGGMFALWSSADSTAHLNIVAQHITSVGTVASGWAADGNLICSAAGNQELIGAIADGTGGFYASWTDFRSSENDSDPYAIRVASSGALANGWMANGNAVSARPDTLEPVGGLCSDGAGGIFLAYTIASLPGTYLQRVSPNGVDVWSTGGKLISNVSMLPPSALTELWGGLVPNGSGGAMIAGSNVSASYAGGQWVDSLGRLAMPLSLLHLRNQSIARTLVPSSAEAAIAFMISTDGNFDLYANNFGGRSNLDGITTWTPNWDAPAVPRNAASGSLTSIHVTPILDGNTANTYYNSLLWLNGPYGTPPWTWAIYLDSEPLLSLLMPDDYGPGSSAFFDMGPVMVRGGRHTLEHAADAFDAMIESNEMDNTYKNQWVWSPYVLPSGTGIQRPVPPIRGTLPLPNQDGFRFDRGAGSSWVISLAARNFYDDYDLYVYDDYTGSSSGFSNLRVSSVFGANAVDFTVGHRDGTPTILYPAAVRYATGGGASDYAFDQIDASGRVGMGSATFSNQLLPQNRLADVYEASLVAGVTYYFLLDRTYGDSDLGLSLFPASLGGLYGRNAATASSQPQGTGVDIIGGFTPTATGIYPVVVYRLFGTEADSPVTYSLTWAPGSTGVDLPNTSMPERFAFQGPHPNPVRAPASMVLQVPEQTFVRLALYDLNGRRVRMLLDGNMDAGEQRIVWDGTDDAGAQVSAGIYFARLEALDHVLTRRLVLLP